jgi:hypothetical protein
MYPWLLYSEIKCFIRCSPVLVDANVVEQGTLVKSKNKVFAK